MAIAYRADIDGLRAIAVISVVVFHAFPELLTGGFVGVDIFFVISGYLITGILLGDIGRGEFSLLRFYDHRIRRIFPALVVVLLASLVLGWLSLYPEEYQSISKHIVGASFFVANIVFWNENGYFDAAAESKPLLHLWSLGVEEQYYVLFPLLLLVLWRARLNYLIAVFVVLVASASASVFLSYHDSVAAFYLLPTRAWELMAGCLLACCSLGSCSIAGLGQSTRFSRLMGLFAWVGEYRSVVGLILLFSGLIFIDKGHVFPGWVAILPVLGAVLLISGERNSVVNRYILAFPLLVRVGLISYPLYLWHWPILSFQRVIQGGEPDTAERLLALVLSLILSVLTYAVVERRIRFLGWKYTSVLLVVVVLVISAVSMNIYSRNGLSFRLRGNQSEMNIFEWRTRGLHYSSECERSLDVGSEVTFCLRSTKAPPGVALVGDSHANHLYHGLAERFSSDSRSLINIGIGGCHPYYDFELYASGVAHGCAAKMNAVIDYVVREKSIHTVILSSHHTLSEFEARGGKFELAYRGLRDRSNLATYQAALANTLSMLLAAGKKVVFVLDVPIQQINPKSCLQRKILPLREVSGPERCTLSPAEFEKDYSTYKRLVLDVLVKYPDILVWNIPDALCNQSGCPIIRDEKILYRDRNHLSLEGSLFVGERFSLKSVAEVQ